MISTRKNDPTTENQNTQRQNFKRMNPERIPQNINLPDNWDNMTDAERQVFMEENRPAQGGRPEGRPGQEEEPKE